MQKENIANSPYSLDAVEVSNLNAKLCVINWPTCERINH